MGGLRRDALTVLVAGGRVGVPAAVAAATAEQSNMEWKQTVTKRRWGQGQWGLASTSTAPRRSRPNGNGDTYPGDDACPSHFLKKLGVIPRTSEVVVALCS